MIGLGIMGSAIARNLVAAGFAVSGFDIDPGKTAALAGIGGVPAAPRPRRRATRPRADQPAERRGARRDRRKPRRRAAAGAVVAELSTFPIEAKAAGA